MTNSVQSLYVASRLRKRVAIPALALAFLFFSGLTTTQSAQAQTFTVLYSFPWVDGANPYAGVVRDAGGNLYGTTFDGGASGVGTVFSVDPAGNETVLHSFTGGYDGGSPYGGLVRDKAGNLYGATYSGGTSGVGTVFKIDTDGTETVLHNFTGISGDGCYPYGGLFRDEAGNLYGTTANCGASGAGTVFKVDPAGKETVLHSFGNGPSDGAVPTLTSLIMDRKGNLYGVTSEGGSAGEGVVYKLSKNRKLTVLHSFTAGKTDGCGPAGTPAMDKQGTLYGTAGCGSSDDGVLWKVSNKESETVLHNFAGGSADGAYPYAGVILDAKGNLYGDTTRGGTFNVGTVYEMTKAALVVIASFGGSTGGFPCDNLIVDFQGNFYGTSETGGWTGWGTVWELTP
jgi:uncharacterized repeat protein (TIGR03803 family)